MRSLCHSPNPKRFDVLAKLAEDSHASVPLRAEAIAGLADDAVATARSAAGSGVE